MLKFNSPWALGYFGPAGYWCWVGDNKFFVFFFYGIIISVILFNAGGSLYISRYLKKLEKLNIVEKSSLIYKLRFYPLIVATLWIFPIFNRFSHEIADYRNDWTHVAHICCESLLGLTNMLYYTCNPKVKNTLKQNCRSIFTKKMIVEVKEEFHPSDNRRTKESFESDDDQNTN